MVYYGFRYRRNVVKNNLELCFPEKTKLEILAIEKEFFHHLCDVVVETIKLLSISEKELKNRMRLENPEFADSIISAGGSYVAMGTHMGNWEWVLAGKIIHLDGKIDFVYKPLHNAFFEKLMLKIRTRFGGFPVPSPSILRLQVSRREIPKGIAMASDQTPGPDNSAVIRFMGRDTLFFKGPPKIASKLSIPIFYVGVRKEARGKYVFWVEEMADPAAVGEENIIRDFASRLERDIRKQPALWLWSHKRWKHKIPQS